MSETEREDGQRADGEREDGERTGGEEPREIVPGCGRALHVRRKRHKYFGKRAKEAFLEHLAATCNVQASAKAAGVAVSTVYAHRMRDAQFAEDWDAALRQGYARLEAALLERAARGADRPRVRGDKTVEGPDSPDEIDWDKGMELLRHHQRGLAGLTARGRLVPKRVPIEQVTAKLIRKFRALGVTLSDRSERPAQDERPDSDAASGPGGSA